MGRRTEIVKANAVKRDTAKAWLIITCAGAEVWLPKSQVALSYFYGSSDIGEAPTLLIEMPEWLLNNNAGHFAAFDMAQIVGTLNRVNEVEDWQAAAAGRVSGKRREARKATRKRQAQPTHEHKGWQFRIYKARSSYDHYRVSFVTMPSGVSLSDRDMVAWGLKYPVYHDNAPEFTPEHVRYYAGGNLDDNAEGAADMVKRLIDRVEAGKPPRLTNAEVNAAMGGHGLLMPEN